MAARRLYPMEVLKKRVLNKVKKALCGNITSGR